MTTHAIRPYYSKKTTSKFYAGSISDGLHAAANTATAARRKPNHLFQKKGLAVEGHPRASWHNVPAGAQDSDGMSAAKNVPQSKYFASDLACIGWEEHFVNMKRAITEIGCKGLLDDGHTTSLLLNLMQGLEDDVYLLPLQLVVDDEERPDNLPPGFPKEYEYANCTSTAILEGERNSVRQGMERCRFTVLFVNHSDDNHWTGILWDSQARQMYHYDSLGGEARLWRAVVLWRELLFITGGRHDFEYYGVPLTCQQQGWECGLLMVRAIANTLRHATGPSYDCLYDDYEVHLILVDGRYIPSVNRPYLPYCDWRLTPPSVEYERALDAVRALAVYYMLEELGDKDKKYGISKYRPKTDDPDKEPSPDPDEPRRVTPIPSGCEHMPYNLMLAQRNLRLAVQNQQPWLNITASKSTYVKVE